MDGYKVSYVTGCNKYDLLDDYISYLFFEAIEEGCCHGRCHHDKVCNKIGRYVCDEIAEKCGRIFCIDDKLIRDFKKGLIEFYNLEEE